MEKVIHQYYGISLKIATSAFVFLPPIYLYFYISDNYYAVLMSLKPHEAFSSCAFSTVHCFPKRQHKH